MKRIFKLDVYPVFIVVSLLIISCTSNLQEKKEESFSVSENKFSILPDSLTNELQSNANLQQLLAQPQEVILPGLAEFRLVPLYMAEKLPAKKGNEFYSSYRYNDYSEPYVSHFMPGIDVLFGYKLLNLGHFNFKTERLTLLFEKPVLIKTLYYPSFIPDSIDNKPVVRNYYLVSVYDEDTNGDTLINRNDLRRFYYFNANNTMNKRLLPAEYSAVRSQYDPPNDVMYIFARQDTNKNGSVEKGEPLHIFWVDLNNPVEAKRLY